EKGLLGGMLQPPLGPWTAKFPSRREALAQAPFRAEWRRAPGIVRHGFTHFELEIEVWRAELPARQRAYGLWIAPHDLARAALPTVMRKIIAHALDAAAPLLASRRTVASASKVLRRARDEEQL
ncbi:MAG TPA: NUDIX domain-containing protein, partial [Rhizomicrobium sp.]